ncbi:vacuolar protein-sorting-associated protein 36-like [Watersipora subatra]|uniref:vacuolar protein-sorting-associated protein 36-like n=1 Tax=Watersipora subatra TaxID=2589382 RepID=UPI00355AE969
MVDRFQWSTVSLKDEEDFIFSAEGVKLYDGDRKSDAYEDGNLVLTSHRLIWTDSSDIQSCLALHLSLIIQLGEEPASFTRSAKVICYLAEVSGEKRGPQKHSNYNFIRWSFRKGGQVEFLRQLKDAVGRKLWELKESAQPSSTYQINKLKHGIAGIERKMNEQQRKTDSTIFSAFEDLDALMYKAKEMVIISKSIASKIEQKQGAITEDETVKFKSYLLSLGIPDPVTRGSHKSNTKYIAKLANEISSFIALPLQECGGMMTLTDLYCRINRARGMELLSPQDLLSACKLLPSLKLPVTLRSYGSGVMVIQLRSNDEELLAAETALMVEENTCLSAHELSRTVGLSVVIAKERLLLAENLGKLCRDDTVEGLKFYINRF